MSVRWPAEGRAVACDHVLAEAVGVPRVHHHALVLVTDEHTIADAGDDGHGRREALAGIIRPALQLPPGGRVGAEERRGGPDGLTIDDYLVSASIQFPYSEYLAPLKNHPTHRDEN